MREALPYRLFDFSSDVGVDAEAPTLVEALVELARGFSHVVTDGSRIEPMLSTKIDVEGTPDLAGTAVGFVNELVFLFDTQEFLAADGDLTVETRDGIHHVKGTLRGQRFDRETHRSGRGVKAATFHDAEHTETGGVHRFHIVLDL